MEKFFERLYFWDEFIDSYRYKSICYICNDSTEPRVNNGSKIEELSKMCSCTSMLMKYDYENDSIVLDGQIYDLKFKTHNILSRIDRDEPIMLNMTSLNLRLLGTLLFNIKKMGFSKVFCSYSEPVRYCKNTIHSREEYIDRFDLYKKFRGIDPIPGFLRENDENKSEKWIVFLGFEGKRPEQIHEQYEFDNVVPVITLPSYQPGWQNYVFAENLDLIKKVEHKPEYVIANSFMSAYDYLEKVVRATPDLYIRVSPLGTKVNALGVLLFSLNHTNNVEILYDNPIEEGRISEGCGKTYVFDISEIISLNNNA